MKITLIGPVYPYRGGIAHYTALLGQNLRQAGHEVQLISFQRQYPAWLYRGKSDRDPSLKPLLTVNASYLLDPFNPLSWWKTFQHIRSFGAERCILQWWTTFWLPAWLGLSLLLLLFSQTKIGFLCHNVLPHEHQSWDRWMSWLVLRFGSFWIVQSQSQQKQLWNLIKREPIVIAPHPIYSMFTDAKIDPEVAKTKLGITKQTHVLLFFGMIRPYKGLDIALHALAQIIVQQKNVMLVVAGDFWGSKTAYVELIQRLKLEDYVQLDDRYIPDEEVAIYFSAADILVAPYRHLTGSGVMRVAESFGVTVATWQQRSASNFAVETQNGDELTDEVKIQQLVNIILEKIETKPQAFSATNLTDVESWQRVVSLIVGQWKEGIGTSL